MDTGLKHGAHSFYGNCSVVQGNIKDKIASASWEPSHALVHDFPDVEIFSFVSSVALFTDHGSIRY